MKFLGQRKIKIEKREQLELALKKEKILRTLITIDNGNGNDRSKKQRCSRSNPNVGMISGYGKRNFIY